MPHTKGMSSTPARYQPSPRLIDQPERLEQLYEDEDLTIRQIANQYADVGRTAVGDALQEYGITDGEPDNDDGDEDVVRSSIARSQVVRSLAPPQSGGATQANSTVSRTASD